MIRVVVEHVVAVVVGHFVEHFVLRNVLPIQPIESSGTGLTYRIGSTRRGSR
jgi:hypothetical protein